MTEKKINNLIVPFTTEKSRNIFTITSFLIQVNLNKWSQTEVSIKVDFNKMENKITSCMESMLLIDYF